MENLNQTRNKCELEIDMTGTLGSQVLKFATVLAKCNNFTLRDLVKNDDKYEAKYYLPIGTTKLKYKDTDMEIIYTRYENNIVGTAHYAEFPTLVKNYLDRKSVKSGIRDGSQLKTKFTEGGSS